MKKSLKMLALIGILGATLWLGGSRKAYALLTCEYLQGRACSPDGSTKVCQYAGTPYTGICECWAAPGIADPLS
jgi:hypothetical protein